MGVGAKETLRAPECRFLFQRILGQKMPMWNGNREPTAHGCRLSIYRIGCNDFGHDGGLLKDHVR